MQPKKLEKECFAPWKKDAKAKATGHGLSPALGGAQVDKTGKGLALAMERICAFGTKATQEQAAWDLGGARADQIGKGLILAIEAQHIWNGAAPGPERSDVGSRRRSH